MSFRGRLFTLILWVHVRAWTLLLYWSKEAESERELSDIRTAGTLQFLLQTEEFSKLHHGPKEKFKTKKVLDNGKIRIKWIHADFLWNGISSFSRLPVCRHKSAQQISLRDSKHSHYGLINSWCNKRRINDCLPDWPASYCIILTPHTHTHILYIQRYKYRICSTYICFRLGVGFFALWFSWALAVCSAYPWHYR